jgi:hypothetical protein
VVAAFANKIDMMTWHSPLKRTAPGLIVDFAAALCARLKRDGRIRPRRSVQWRRSYLAGVVMAERLQGLLGLEGLDLATLKRAGLATALPSRGAGPDERALESGIRDMIATNPTPEGLREFVGSEKCQVLEEELPMLTLALGGAGEVLMPLRWWPDRDHERA